MLREVRRYTPSHSFGSVPDVGDGEDDQWSESEDSDVDDMEDEEQANEIDSEPGSPGRSAAAFPSTSSDADGTGLRRKGVSFAKYAEMRLFRE